MQHRLAELIPYLFFSFTMAWPLPFVLGISSVGSMAYVYYGVLRLPRGLTRLMATIPLIAFYMYMPLTFNTVFMRGVYSFFFVWLTSFKLALLCWDEGPAADPWAVASFPRFIAVMNLSLHLKRQKFSEREKEYIVTATNLRLKRKSSPEMVNGSSMATSDRITSVTRRTHIVDNPTNTSTANNGDDLKPSRKHEYSWIEIFSESMAWQMVWLRLIVKFVAIGCICYLYTFRESIPPMVLYFVYCWHMYIVCSLMFEGIAATVSPLLGIELEAAYDKPFLAHSLGNFWGQRWNILISDLLRVSVYDPILLLCSGTGERSAMKSADSAKSTNGVHKNMATPSSNGSAHSGDARISHLSANPPLWARSIGMFSCFLVSGLMHELIFYYMNQTKPTWEGTAFFTLNGAATLAELAIRKKTQLQIPKIVSVPLTLTFLFVTAIWLFFPALCGPGTDTKSIAEFQHFFGQVYLTLWGS